ncbi:DNA helicase [Yersinia phage vB_Yru_GN1]|uniref:DNA helicase n=1 Tax=Yersinia phage vB_Yru_GN1 TaxID=3074381 RepID=A0AA86MC62_9CAUD|nr:DNA helicase [Yersinia phage vB_Yru_GN1]
MLNHFPYDPPRPIQVEVLDELMGEFINNNDKKLAILELPTGIGKSAIGYTIARYYETGEKFTRFLTKTKHLQDQYVSDFPKISSIKGKGNYTEEEFMLAKMRFDQNFIGLTNYANMPNVYTGEVLIIDEGHEFINYLTELMHFNLSKTKFVKSKYLTNIIELLSKYSKVKVSSIFNNLTYFILSQVRLIKRAQKLKLPIPKIDDTVMELYKLVKLLVALNPDIQIRTINHAKSVEFYIDGVSEYFNHIVKTHKKVIIMSANFGNIEFYLEVLGYNKDLAFIKSVQESPFLPENRPIIFVKSHSMGSSNKVKRLKSLVEEVVDNILDIEYRDDNNGIIHTVSYENAELIKKYSRYADKMEIVKHHSQLKNVKEVKGRILLSPSIEEGVGFKGDDAVYQLLLKAPIEPVTGVNKFLVWKYGRSYMNRKAALRVTQIYGRIIRSETCSGNTYIVDKNFGRISGSKSKKFYPKYFWDNFKSIKSI